MPRFFRNALILLAIAIATGIATFFTTRYQENHHTAAVTVTDFAYTDIAGRTTRLADNKNQQIIVHFWATWCIPCRSELPELLATARLHPETLFLLISVDDDSDAVKNFIASYPKENAVFILDDERKIAGQMHVTAFPESFVLNPGLVLRQHLTGPVHWASYPF